jgi:hypothetical protein
MLTISMEDQEQNNRKDCNHIPLELISYGADTRSSQHKNISTESFFQNKKAKITQLCYNSISLQQKSRVRQSSIQKQIRDLTKHLIMM